MAETIAQMINVSGGYQNGNFVIKDINATFKTNELTAIIGPNGTGKSTLLRALQGTLHYMTGKVEILGKDINSYNLRLRARIIGTAHTPTREIDLTALQYCVLGRTARRSLWSLSDSQQDIEAAKKAMAQTGIESLSDRRLKTLSDGERQLTGIAMALAQEPRLLLLDEPTANLDPKNQQIVLQTIKEITTRNTSISTVAIVHNIEAAMKWSDSIIMLRDGHIAYNGKTAETLNTETLSVTYGIDFEPLYDKQGAPKGFTTR